MGYVHIPKLGVSLPIYHGTEEETLDRGIGHLIGSSLPIGGGSTHAILTGHSGLASQKMFSDLDKLEIGDTFYLEVLNEVLAYEVDQINTVLPHDTTYLGLEDGKDLCTLVTCTPFGVNTHRLLIRGHRIAYTPEDEESPTIEPAETSEPVDSTWEQEYEKHGCVQRMFQVIRVSDTQTDGQAVLRVAVHQQYLVPLTGKADAQVNGRGRFPDTSLLIDKSNGFTVIHSCTS